MANDTTPERVAQVLSEVIDVAKEMNPNLRVEVLTFANDAPALAVSDGDTWEEVQL